MELFAIVVATAAVLGTVHQRNVPIACDRNAFTGDVRLRHAELLAKIRTSHTNLREKDDGFEFEIAEQHLSLDQAAKWLDLERRCCPFLALTLRVEGANGPIRFQVSGPAGAKDFIRAEILGDKT